jgi:DnaJ-class molecular chaperone
LRIAQPNGEVRTVQVRIPAGLRPGKTLRIPRQGGPGAGGGAAGDLRLKVRLADSSRGRVEGDDVVTDVDVPAPLAVVGGTARVDAPDGPVTIKIPPGTQAGRVLRVRGRGLPRADGSRGDLRARVRLVVPAEPNEKERQLYASLKAELEGAAHSSEGSRG